MLCRAHGCIGALPALRLTLVVRRGPAPRAGRGGCFGLLIAGMNPFSNSVI
jgi:hypothetical protein